MRHFLLLAALLLLSVHVCAQVKPAPSLMNFQGRLTKPDGTPVPNGNYSLRFSLWDAASGGNEKFHQTVNPVAVKNGTFAVLLDVGAPATLFSASLWLEIKIGAEAPLTPRQQLVPVAFALKANTVPDDSIGTAQLADSSITSVKIADNSVSNADLLSDALSLSKVSAGALTLTSNRLFVPNGVIQRGGSAVTGTQDLGLYSQLGSNWMRFVTNVAPFKWFSDSGAGTTPIMTLTQGGSLALGSIDPGMSLEVTTPTYYSAPALGASNGTKYAYLHVGPSDHSLIWNSTSGMRFGTESSRGAGYVERMRIASNGNVGIGVGTPLAKLDVRSAGIVNVFAGDRTPFGVSAFETDFTVGQTHAWFAEGGVRVFSVTNGGAGYFAGNVGIGTTTPAVKLDVNGTARAKIVEVTGGSDVAEPYHVAPAGAVKPLPGMVVSIDPNNTGQMRVAARTYDRTVAGIISGANGIKPGITLRQEGTIADGELPVASIGRVWCWCDADANGAIEAGDMLTTSDTPGHAMKVSDYNRANGAGIGKAMSALKSGKGLVLVLVSLK